MDNTNDALPLTNRHIAIPQDPAPITPRARAADQVDNMKRHRTFFNSRLDYSIPKRRQDRDDTPSAPVDNSPSQG